MQDVHVVVHLPVVVDQIPIVTMFGVINLVQDAVAVKFAPQILQVPQHIAGVLVEPDNTSVDQPNFVSMEIYIHVIHKISSQLMALVQLRLPVPIQLPLPTSHHREAVEVHALEIVPIFVLLTINSGVQELVLQDGTWVSAVLRPDQITFVRPIPPTVQHAEIQLPAINGCRQVLRLAPKRHVTRDAQPIHAV